MNECPIWWPRVTIRGLLTWPAVALTGAGGVISYFVGNSVSALANPATGAVIATGAMAVFFAAIALILLATRSAAFSYRSESLPVVSVAVASALLGGAVWWAHGYFEVPDSKSLGLRVLASLLAIVPIALISTMIVSGARDYRKAYRDIELLQATLGQIDHHAADHIEAYTRDALDTAERGLRDATTALRDAARGENVAQALATIRRVSNQVVAPLSTHLRLPELSVPRPEPLLETSGINWSRLWRTALAERPHWPLLTASVFGASVIPYSLNSVQPSSSLLISLAWTVLLFGILRGQNIILGALPAGLSFGARVASVSLLSVLGTAVAAWLTEWGGQAVALEPETLTVLGNLALSLPAVMALVLLARGLLLEVRHTVELREQLERECESRMTLVNEVFWERRSALSHALHGPIQAALNAVELRSRSAIEKGQFDQALAEELCWSLESSAAQLARIEREDTNVTLILEGIRDTWQGLCEVSWDASAELLARLSTGFSSAGIADILVEAVFNAVRHATARVVHISITLRTGSTPEQTVVITVDNDGKPVSPAQLAGQGSELFDLLSQRWSLTALSPSETLSTRLRLEVPLSSPMHPGTGDWQQTRASVST